MNRVNVISRNDENTEFKGWFDLNSAVCLAKHEYGNPYVNYEWIYLTKGKKLILNESNNYGNGDKYYPFSAKKALELIIESGTKEGAEWIDDKEQEELLKQFEI